MKLIQLVEGEFQRKSAAEKVMTFFFFLSRNSPNRV